MQSRSIVPHNRLGRSGQVVLEFVFMVAFAMLIGAVTMVVAFDLMSEASERQRYAAIQDAGYAIQDELILAATVDDGYRRIIDVPDRADRFQYTLTTDADGAGLSVRSGQYALTFDIPPIMGEVHDGATFLIRKSGTVIVVEVIG